MKCGDYLEVDARKLSPTAVIAARPFGQALVDQCHTLEAQLGRQFLPGRRSRCSTPI